MKISYFLLIYFSLFGGCTTGKLIKTPSGNNITKNAKWRFKDQFSLADTTFLSVSHVYRDECYPAAFLKFFSNGRVLYGQRTSNFSNSYLRTDNLCGYYKINANELIIELSYGQTGNDWSRLVIKGIVSGDTLKFNKDQWGGSGRNIGHFTNITGPQGQKCYFLRTNETATFRTPDW
jgi:hypothetical protein